MNQGEILIPYIEIAKWPEKVAALCKELDVPIRPQSDLAKIIRLCTGINGTVETMNEKKLLEVCHAQRVLGAIVACSTEKALKTPLSRIASNALNPASRKPSQGKEAVFELEFLQYVRQKGLEARLGEPDVVVSAPFGDYFIACKTINSLKNFEKQLSEGTKQVRNHGFGCIAINLEPNIGFVHHLNTEDYSEVAERLGRILVGLYHGYERHFNNRLEAGKLDGVVLQMSCFAKIAGSKLDMSTCTSTVFYSRPDIMGREAKNRFSGFQASMTGPSPRHIYA